MPSLKDLIRSLVKAGSSDAFPGTFNGSRIDLNTELREYTAPCDGYFCLYTNALPNEIDLYGRGIPGDDSIRTRFSGNPSKGPISFTIPVRKGSTVKFTATATIQEIWFTKAGNAN